MTPEPKPKGGKREGAGRKPAPEKRQNVQTMLLPATIATLDRKRGAMTRRDWIESKINE